MYSLDQVIYFLEQSEQTEDWNIRDAAIAYLRGYREILPEYAQMKLDAVNDPLTWDVLKGMTGEPVWIKTKRYGSRWYLVEDTSYEEMIVFTGLYGERAPYFQDDLGKTWQAYRKERE